MSVSPIATREFAWARSGCRMMRTASQSSRTGTATPARPNVPATTPWTTLPNVPWMPHHSRAATTTARAMRVNATPSRRCAGSRSLAPLPMVRTSDPTPCAAPSQTPAPRGRATAALPPADAPGGARWRRRTVRDRCRRATCRGPRTNRRAPRCGRWCAVARGPTCLRGRAGRHSGPNLPARTTAPGTPGRVSPRDRGPVRSHRPGPTRTSGGPMDEPAGSQRADDDATTDAAFPHPATSSRSARGLGGHRDDLDDDVDGRGRARRRSARRRPRGHGRGGRGAGQGRARPGLARDRRVRDAPALGPRAVVPFLGDAPRYATTRGTDAARSRERTWSPRLTPRHPATTRRWWARSPRSPAAHDACPGRPAGRPTEGPPRRPTSSPASRPAPSWSSTTPTRRGTRRSSCTVCCSPATCSRTWRCRSSTPGRATRCARTAARSTRSSSRRATSTLSSRATEPGGRSGRRRRALRDRPRLPRRAGARGRAHGRRGG